MEITIVPKTEIPLIRHKRSKWINEIYEKLKTLPDENALCITLNNLKETRALQSNLFYYKNKRHRMTNVTYPEPLKDYKIAMRNNHVFIFREEE